jgi:hypothetical protein
MKRIFLLIVIPALLIARGFAQTPAASGNTDQVNITGCLGGSDGGYTVAEDNTGKIFKITTSADLKAYVGQDVKLTGSKAGATENSLAVTEVNMISEHCITAAAAPAATHSTTAETIGTPATAVAATAAASPAATVSTTPETVVTPPATTAVTDATAPAAATAPVAAPASTVSTPAETVSATPAIAAAPAPAPTISTPSAAAAVHRTRPSDQPQKPAAKIAAPSVPASTASTSFADATAPAAHVDSPSEAANSPASPAAAPAKKTSTGRTTLMLISIVVVVLLIGTTVPLCNRWRKQRLLDRTSSQNLSFTHKASSDPGSSGTTGGRKAA